MENTAKNRPEITEEMLAAELKECAEESTNLDIRMETVKNYREEMGGRTQKLP